MSDSNRRPGAEDAKRPVDLIQQLERKAQEGNASAQNDLGILYLNGSERVPQDQKRAAALFGQAAKQGYPTAIHNLGLCYANGFGIPKDEKKAVGLYTQAATMGIPEAQFSLGEILEQGKYGVPKDEKEAFIQYRKSADQGYIHAQFKIAYAAFQVGRFQEAFQYYKKAADLGDHNAQLQVAKMYEEKRGTEVDYLAAKAYFQKAVDQKLKDSDATQQLDRFIQSTYTKLYELKSIPPVGHILAPPKVKIFVETEAERNVPKALLALGYMHEKGLAEYKGEYKELKKNESTALGFYKKALEQANQQSDIAARKQAEKFIGEMYRYGLGTQQDFHQAAYYFRRAEMKYFARTFPYEAQNNIVMQYHFAMANQDSFQFKSLFNNHPEVIFWQLRQDLQDSVPKAISEQALTMVVSNLDYLREKIKTIADTALHDRLAALVGEFYLKHKEDTQSALDCFMQIKNPKNLTDDENILIGSTILGLTQGEGYRFGILHEVLQRQHLDYNQLHKKGLQHMYATVPQPVDEKKDAGDIKGLEPETIALPMDEKKLEMTLLYAELFPGMGMGEEIKSTQLKSTYEEKIKSLDDKTKELRHLGWRQFSDQLQQRTSELERPLTEKMSQLLDDLEIKKTAFEASRLDSKDLAIMRDAMPDEKTWEPVKQSLNAVIQRIPLLPLYHQGVATQDNKLVEQAAMGGLPIAEYELARHFWATDEKQSASWMKKAAKHDYASAQVHIGNCYLVGFRGFQHDAKKAEELYLKAAAQKDDIQASAMGEAKLGILYAEGGVGVARDDSKAYAYLKKVEEHNFPDAQRKLGVLYLQGRGVPRDYKKAHDYFQKVISHPEVSDPKTKVHHKKAYAEALTSVGDLYARGHGVPKDYTQAARYYKDAIEKTDNARAKLHFGLLHLNPEAKDVVPQDAKLAFAHCKAAADQGNRTAQFKVAQMFMTGQGTGVDKEQAFRYYKQAADQGHVAAQFQVAWAYENARDEKQAAEFKKEAIKYYKLAAEGNPTARRFEKGNRDAQFWIAANASKIPELKGIDSFQYYKKAADLGHLEAQWKVAEAYESKNANHEAYGYYKKAAQNKSVDEKASGNMSTKAQAKVDYFDAEDAWSRYWEHFDVSDLRLAINLYYKAAHQGVAGAMYSLAYLYKNERILDPQGHSYSLAERNALFHQWLTAAADHNYPKAIEKLAENYSYGYDGAPKDVFKALDYYSRIGKYDKIDFQLNLLQEKFFEQDHKANDPVFCSISKLCFDLHEMKPDANYQSQAYRAMASAYNSGFHISQDDEKFIGTKVVSLLKDLSGGDAVKKEEAKKAVAQILRNGQISDCVALYERARRSIELHDLKESKSVDMSHFSQSIKRLDKLGWKAFVQAINNYAKETAHKIHTYPVFESLSEKLKKVRENEKLLDKLAELRLKCEMAENPEAQNRVIEEIRAVLKTKTFEIKQTESRFSLFTPELRSIRAVKAYVNAMLKTIAKEKEEHEHRPILRKDS